MKTLVVRNVNQAVLQGIDLLASCGHSRESRAGDVLVYDSPVTTQYLKPNERVLFWAARDANPFFHLYEALYMLSGSNALEPLEWFVKRMRNFSDDGLTLQGFYGYRWRSAFDLDQLDIIVERLAADHNDRRSVLQMWSAELDLGVESSDVPCNTTAYLAINTRGELDLTVCNRSNDIIWGAYGANVVHMSLMQEYLAGQIGVPVGRYWQMSNNYHAYRNTLDPLLTADRSDITPNHPYTLGVKPLPLYHPDETKDIFEEDLFVLAEMDLATITMEEGLRDLRSFFIPTVMLPMIVAYQAYKAQDFKSALEMCSLIVADDWRLASTQWMERRYAVHQAARS